MDEPSGWQWIPTWWQSSIDGQEDKAENFLKRKEAQPALTLEAKKSGGATYRE